MELFTQGHWAELDLNPGLPGSRAQTAFLLMLSM